MQCIKDKKKHIKNDILCLEIIHISLLGYSKLSFMRKKRSDNFFNSNSTLIFKERSIQFILPLKGEESFEIHYHVFLVKEFE